MTDEARDLLDDLGRRVATRQAAGDYDLDWLDAEVEPVDPLTPVDRYLQTPDERGAAGFRRRVVTLLAGRSSARRRAELERLRREALAWLTLALTAEQRAREGLAAPVAGHDLALKGLQPRVDRLEPRVGNLERDIQALGFALGERTWRLEDDRRWMASHVLRGLYRDLAAPAAGPLDLEGAECRVFSQNGEDGILLHLFSLIGVTDRRFVEIGVENGRECNTANLALNFGWSGVMVDRDPEGVASARTFYAGRPRTRDTVEVIERHVTREGIDDLLVDAVGGGEIDLLSIDIDGNDLWVWEAVRSTSPRVMVIEYNASFGPDRSVSVPYDPDFDRMARHPSGYYHGASLEALTRVSARKGYVLAGCDGNGVNAFFVRGDLAEGVIAPAEAGVAWRPIRERGPKTTAEQFAVIADLPLEDVP